jgi:hypothetical protein
VALLAAGALAWIVASGGTAAPALDSPTTAAAPTSDPALAVVDVVPAPAELTGTATADGVSFTWTNPEPRTGDSYDWQRVRTGGPEEAVNRVSDPAVTITGVAQACIEVVIVRDDGSSSVRPAQACVGEAGG